MSELGLTTLDVLPHADLGIKRDRRVVAVIGLDDVVEGRFAVPRLSTVAPDKRGIARTAVGMLATDLYLPAVPSLPQQLGGTVVHAQATLAGTVRDASGAVLPGVTVEASSPVLIQKVRQVVTDGTGQYRIPELPPGMYTVTFSLSGFSTVRRQEVSVSGVGVAPDEARAVAYLPQGQTVHWPVAVHQLVALGRLPLRPAMPPTSNG